jgi:hypothetical protein
MALIREGKVGGEPCEVEVPAGNTLQRRTHAETNAVARDRRTGRGTEDSAQMVGRHSELSREVR